MNGVDGRMCRRPGGAASAFDQVIQCRTGRGRRAHDRQGPCHVVVGFLRGSTPQVLRMRSEDASADSAGVWWQIDPFKADCLCFEVFRTELTDTRYRKVGDLRGPGHLARGLSRARGQRLPAQQAVQGVRVGRKQPAVVSRLVRARDCVRIRVRVGVRARVRVRIRVGVRVRVGIRVGIRVRVRVRARVRVRVRLG